MLRLTMTCGVAALLGLLVSANDARAQQRDATPAKVVVYTGATVIDGTGAPPQTDMAIVTRGERIEAIVPRGTLQAQPEIVEQVDVTGLYAVPGLIDAHVHLATQPDRTYAVALLRRSLYSGVTAVRDMSGDGRLLAELAREALMGEIPASDIYYAAAMVGPSFVIDPRSQSATRGFPPGQAPWLQAIAADTDLKLAVARARGTGATGVKIYSDLSPALVEKIAAEARRQGMKVWAHGAVFPTRPQQVVLADIDVISHTGFVGLALAPRLPEHYSELQRIDMRSLLDAYHDGDPTLRDIFKEMRRRGEILDATVSTARNIEQALPGALAKIAAMTRQAYEAGVSIAAGTDVRVPDEQPYPALHGELELLAHEVGMTPMDVIRSATLVNATTIGREGEMGSLAAGKLANIVFVSKNPLEEISNLQSVTLTVKRGARFSRGDFRPIAADEHARR